VKSVLVEQFGKAPFEEVKHKIRTAMQRIESDRVELTESLEDDLELQDRPGGSSVVHPPYFILLCA
jgi:hypothetical protein